VRVIAWCRVETRGTRTGLTLRFGSIPVKEVRQTTARGLGGALEASQEP
jgi:hypothetical protein